MKRYTVKESTLTQIHKYFVFRPYNEQICVWDDGKITLMSSNSSFSPEDPAEGLVCIIPAQNISNLDSDYYSDGWCVWNQDEGLYIEIDTGRKLTQDQMLEECIENGDHVEVYNHWATKYGFDIAWGT